MTISKKKSRFHTRRWAGLAVALLALIAAPAAAEEDYGYIRTVEGEAFQIEVETGERSQAQLNFPVLPGDGLILGRSARLEAVLPDGSLLRIAGDSEVWLEKPVNGYEQDTAPTHLRLVKGEIQLVVPAQALAAEPQRVDTVNATLYVQNTGSYAISADPYSRTQMVAREGQAEVVTASGSAVLRAGEEAVIDGSDWPRIDLRTASYRSPLEAWGDNLSAAAYAAASPYLEEPLRYQSASLANNGAWISVSGRRAWRPRVAVGWTPYSTGWWTPTPRGLNWVAYEPWGYLTHHYGTWNLEPSYGWVWFPGYSYSPGWVYWYWGPSYVGWVPVGYYTHHYGSHYGRYGFGFRFGFYGWAGGSWGHFNHWTFASSRHMGRPHNHHHYRSGGRLARETRLSGLPRGIITTDTRAVHRGALSTPEKAFDTVRTIAGRSGYGSSTRNSLPDVTSFVARDRDLPREVAEVIQAKDTRERLRADTPSSAGSSAYGSRVSGREEIGSARASGYSSKTTDQPSARTEAMRADDWRDLDRYRDRYTTRKTTISPGSSSSPREDYRSGIENRGSDRPQSSYSTKTPRTREDYRSEIEGRSNGRPQSPSSTGTPRTHSESWREQKSPSGIGSRSTGAPSGLVRPYSAPGTGSSSIRKEVPPARRVLDGIRSYSQRSQGGTAYPPSRSVPPSSYKSTVPNRPSVSPPSSARPQPPSRPTVSAPPSSRGYSPGVKSAPPPSSHGRSSGAKSSPPSRSSSGKSSASGTRSRGKGG